MVLGLRSKSRKRVSTQVHYVIHVQEIKPWPPSQLLRSAQSVLLQWENGDKNSGSFASISSNGKIEFNKSFRLPVTLWKKASKKGTQHGKFQKNCLEFHLYECQNEKAVKSQLLGSATIKLADFGIIKETTAISTQVSCKRRFRNSAQAILYVIIEPFDVESFGSSPKSSLSRELSLDKEESESTLQSVNEGNDEDLGIASFTDFDDDDDDDDSSSTSSQTVRSAYETTGDSSKISEGGTSGFNGEFNQPLETSATFLVKEEVGTSKQLNGIRFHSSDMGTATNDRCSLSKLPEESGRLADSSYKVPESIKQPKRQIKGVLDKVVTSPSYIPVGLQTNLESSSQSQVTKEDSITPKDIGRGQGFNGEFFQPLETSTTILVKEEVGTSKQLNGIRYHSSDMGNATNDRSSLSKLPEESGRLADSSYRVPESIQQPNKQIKGALDKVVTSISYIPVGLQTNLESSSQSQVTKEDSIIPKDIGRGQGFNGEFIQPLETSATFLVKEEVGTSKQLNGIRSHSSDMGNATNDISSLSKLPEESGKLADSSYKVPESIEQPKKQIKGILDKVVTSPSYIPVVLKTKHESSSQSQVTKEGSKIPKDIGRRQGFNGEFVQPLETSATFLVKEEVGTSKQLNGIRFHSSDMGNATNDRSSLSKLPEESGRLADSSYKVPESIEQPNKQIKGVLDKGVTSSSCIPVGLQTNLESSSQSQVTKEDSIILNNIGRGQGYNTCGKEKVGGVFKTDILVEDQDGKEKKGKGQEEQINKKPAKNELGHNFPGDDFRKKGKIKIATLPLSRISNEWPKNVLMNEKLDDVATVKLPLDAAEGYELFSKSQAQDQEEKINTLKDVHASVVCHPATDMNESLAQDREEKINTLKDVHVSAVCHPATDMNDNIPNNRTKLKSEVQMLREELREAAALEVSLYSVVAEHGSSANKVHAPARRLSRFYFHAYRAGIPATRASAAQSAVSGFVLVSKACGNDVPRLTFWFSNLILLRTIVRKGLEKMPNAYGLCFNSEHDGCGLVDRSSLRSSPYLDEKKEIGVENFCNWEDPQTFLIALEKVEAWIFSRIVESVWWQTLTPHMQPAAAKSSSSRKFYGRKNGLGDQQQGSFSNDLWKRAFKDACERLCPLRAGGLECGCLPVIARLVMEQLVNRLDVAMFNAILRESDEEMPTDPISDPISDSKVLPIPAGKSGFGAGAQLKNALSLNPKPPIKCLSAKLASFLPETIGNWSRWLSDLFGIDDSDPPEDSNENQDNKSSESETSFKVFHLLNALSDLMMLPFEMLADSSSRKEVCPRFGVQLIKRVLNNFVPDEFCPGPIPDAVFDALNAEDEGGSITNVPCTAASIIYSTPPAASVMGILQDVGTHTPNISGSSVLKKSYTSDDEMDDLDSPLSAIGIDDLSLASKFSAGKQGRRVVRYELLREAWRDSE